MGVRAEHGAKSIAEKSRIAKFDTLEASLFYTIAPLSYTVGQLGKKSLSDLLEIAKLCKEFFWMSGHLKEHRKREKLQAFLNELTILLDIELLEL